MLLLSVGRHLRAALHDKVQVDGDVGRVWSRRLGQVLRGRVHVRHHLATRALLDRLGLTTEERGGTLSFKQI